MNDLTILIVQIFSIIAYVGTLFGLYRLLVSQKDATIDLLKEKIGFLENRLDAAKSESPSVLAEALGRRVELFKDELARLREDHDSLGKDRDRLGEEYGRSAKLLREKELELSQAQNELETFRIELEKAREVLSEYSSFSCPYCGAMLVEQSYMSDTGMLDGKEIDFDHELISYECGLTIHDGREFSPCPKRSLTDSSS